MENLNRFFETLKRILSYKRTKVTIYIVAVLWLAVAMQMVMNRVFYEDLQITQAFVDIQSDELKSSLDIVAEYEREYLSEEDKKDLIIKMANSIGLTLDKEITINHDGTRSEYSFVKQAKRANTTLKVVSLEQEVDSSIKMEHYIIIRLYLSDGIPSMDQFREKLEKCLNDIGAGKPQITLQYEGSIMGSLTLEEKEQIADRLVSDLKGETALKYDESGIYTVYAFTGLIDEYIVSMGSRVNIQVAISYDEQADKTMVYLATPILNVSW